MDDHTEAIDNLNSLAWEMRLPNIERSIALSQEAHTLSRQHDYRKGIAQSLRNLAEFASRQSKYDLALAHANDALRHFRELKDTEGEAETLNIIGNTYLLLGNTSDSLIYFLRAQDASQIANSKRITADTLNHIGQVHNLQNNHEVAMTYYDRSRKLYREIDYDKGVADTLDNSGDSARELGQFRRGLEYCLEALEIYLSIGDKQGQAEVITTIGNLYIALQDHEQATGYFETAREISAEIGNTFQETQALLSIAKLQQIENDLEGAIHTINQAMQTGAEIRQHLYQCHYRLAQIYKLQNNHTQALTHFEQYIEIKDAVINQEAEQRIKNLKTAHEVEMHQLRNIELQSEVQERRQVESALKQEIAEREQLIEDLDAYAHTVAHDLKSPTAIILGYTDLLISDLKTVINDENMEMLLHVFRSAEKMQFIIEELLILASIRKDRVVRYPLEMDVILTEVQYRLKELIADKQATVNLITDNWPLALGYAPWIEEVWVNYISNAIKYGGHPPVITIGAAQQDDMVRFWVQDNGHGIAPEYLSQVFTPLQRLEAHKRQVDGHGLGLSIVKRIVRKLGGEVSVESENVPGQGAVFSFTLPVSAADSDEIDQTTRQTPTDKSLSPKHQSA